MELRVSRALLVQRERPVFEAWAAPQGYDMRTFDVEGCRDTTYVCAETREAYAGWLARALIYWST